MKRQWRTPFKISLSSLLGAQFLNTLADNALLVGLLVILIKAEGPSWAGALLQGLFICAFIFLAPLAGPLSELYSKRSVLLAANSLKLGGALLMLGGSTPYLGYAVVGMGAALYAPAKYGILPELLRSSALVRGNGIMDAVSVVALLTGALLGGLLGDKSYEALAMTVTGLYLLGIATTLFIIKVPAAHPGRLDMRYLGKEFVEDTRKLWAVGSAKLSMLGTGLFWGSEATLKLMLVAWVPFALHNSSGGMIAILTALIAIGIAVGATFAAYRVKLSNSYKVLSIGPLIPCLIVLVAVTPVAFFTGLFLVMLGCLGGFYVVPLNAQIQEVGHLSIGAGKSIAVQNLIEHVMMLLMIGFYSLLVELLPTTPVTTMTVTGGVFCLAFTWLFRLRSQF